MNKKRLDGVCPLITDPPPNSLTTLEKLNKNKNYMCGYWNKGFCREGRPLPLYYTILYQKHDCQMYLNTGDCKDRECQGRHWKSCRYYNSKTEQEKTDNPLILMKDIKK